MSNTGSAVATITSGANTSNPTIVLNSLGTFNIVATVSSIQNYTGTTLTSLPIRVWPDIPDIEFSPNVTEKSPYTYRYEDPYDYIEPAASITNNTGQTLNYSIVTADSTINSLTPSTVATIDPSGCFLTTVSCGDTGTSTFRICASADERLDGDFGPNKAVSDILTIVKATPTILQYPQINLPTGVTASTLVYGQEYTINPIITFPPQSTTISSNTDTNPYPTIIYSIIGNIIGTNNPVATISGSTVTITGIGHFQIATSVSSTTNYNQILPSPSPQIYETKKAVPTIKSFPTILQTLVYKGTPYVIPSTIRTSNTDIPGPSIVTYTSSDTNVATISGNTITVAGVTGIVNGIGTGNYQILVTIAATTNFSEITYTYPSLTTYYQTIWATPDITFSKKAFVTSSIYGSTYNFVAPILTNSDPSQLLTYSIVNSVPGPGVASDTIVAKIVPNPQSQTLNPSVVINSVGTFQIQASCLASSNAFYSPQSATSDLITISKEIPNIVFNTSKFKSSYTYQPTPYPLTNPIASITPNNGNQILTYSIVATDGVTPSTVATISSIGTGASQIIYLTTKSVGSSFKILATAAATSNGDYGPNSVPSETIMIISGTPTITTFPTLPSMFIYGNQYTIPYTNTPPYTITTSNTDIPGPTITYSSSNTAVATISGSVNYSSISNSAISSINGTSITIVGVGQFQINVTIGATTYYNKATYVYPSPTTYYTSIQATPTITFPSNFGSGWVIGVQYNLTSTVTTNAGSGYTDPNAVSYSLVTSNNKVKMVAVVSNSGGTNSIAYSYDGIYWTGAGNSFMSSCSCVAWNGSIWLVGGNAGPVIIFSVNGINWFPANSVTMAYVGSIAWNGTIWVAVGLGSNSNQIQYNYNTISYSYDGINWTVSNNSKSIFSNSGNGIAWNGSIWVAVGSGTTNTIAYSSDGINWTGSNNSLGIFSNGGNGIAWNGSIWVAVGNGTNSIAYSSDGINWTGSNNSTTIFSSYGSDIAWNGTIWVAVGGGTNSMAYSPDGVNWTASNNSTNIFGNYSTGISWNGSLWSAVGSSSSANNAIAYSSDGANWIGANNINGGNSTTIFSYGSGIGSTVLVPYTVTSPKPVIVALSYATSTGSSTISSTIYYSNDGMNWSPAYGINSSNNSGTIFSSSGTGVAWNGSMWVAVGSGTNTIAYSINGQYWYPSNNSINIFSSYGQAVAWNGSMWVAVGSGTNTIAYSPDGINWTGANNINGSNSTTIFSNSGNGIAWNGSMWVAVGSGTNSIAYSSDGINWTGSNNSTTIFSNSGNGIAWNGEMWVAVGSGTNTIAWSNDGINWTAATNSVNGSNSTTIFSSSGNDIAWNEKMWVAVGGGTNNTIAYSYDGKNWTGVGNSIFSSSGNGVTWYVAYNMWVVTGRGSYDIGYSKDGINWFPVNNSANIFTGTGSYGMAVASTSSVVFYTNQGNTNNVATISKSGSQITINDVGSFQIQASLAATNNFLPALPVQSNIITIVPSNVSILSNNFSNFVYGGGPYTLQVVTNNTDTNPRPFITYTIFTQSGSTGNGTITGNQLTITAAGGAYIYVNISQTQNFNSLNTCIFVNIAQATQVFSLNWNWLSGQYTSLIVGSSFMASGAILSNSSNNTDPGGPTYTFWSSGNYPVMISGGMINCVGPGSFTYSITAAATANFKAVTLTTPVMYICVVPEVIIFNNPQTFPPTASQNGEVGMAICITADGYPNGFNNYSALTITNGGNSFTLNAQTSPTYSSVLNNYMVFFEPLTQPNNPNFSAALSTSTASNIAYVGTNPIAYGVVSGPNLTFTFSGVYPGTVGPDPLSFNWNPGSLDISQGLVYGAFFSLANNITTNIPYGSGVTISTLNSGGITGYYTAPWAGYNTISTTGGFVYINSSVYSDVQQAWGLWDNGQLGSTYNLNGSNYFVGIPLMTNPLAYYP